MARQQANWATLLEWLYKQEEPNIERSSNHLPHTIPDSEPIVSEVELSRQEIDSAINFLENSGLISEASNGSPVWELTESGFAVAHDRIMQARQVDRENQRSRRQSEINSAIGYLTLGLLLTAFFDTLIGSLIGAGGLQDTINLATGILAIEAAIVLLIGGLVVSSGLISPVESSDKA